jgi:hypothetical protein
MLEFEEHIRKKLESIEVERQEKDWLRFKDKFDKKPIAPKKPSIIWGRGFKIAASIVLVSSIFLATAQFGIITKLKTKVEQIIKENTQLHHDRKLLEQKIERLELENEALTNFKEQYLESKNKAKAAKNNIKKRRVYKVKKAVPPKDTVVVKKKFFARVKDAVFGIFKKKKAANDTAKVDSTAKEIIIEEPDSSAIKKN